ncbi:MAG: hypothetical protein H7144_18150 [Burkholderiales bacterium]|nr:hypothetical protein [Phycisphaerae bacterium]
MTSLTDWRSLNDNVYRCNEADSMEKSFRHMVLSLDRLKDRIESLFFLLLAGACILTTFLTGIVVFFLQADQTAGVSGAYLAMLGATLIFGILEAFAMNFIVTAYNTGRVPLVPLLAMSQRRWPKPLVPLVVLFWISHWAAAMIILYTVERIGFLQPISAWPDAVFYLFGYLILGFGICYGGNLYLLLGISAITVNQRLIDGFWKWRFPVDTLLTLLVTLMAHQSIEHARYLNK